MTESLLAWTQKLAAQHFTVKMYSLKLQHTHTYFPIIAINICEKRLQFLISHYRKENRHFLQMKVSLFFLRSNRVNDTSHVQCERPACSGKSSRRCKHSYTCNAVIARVHYSGGNRSELVQIYATYDESEKYTGAV